MYKVLDAKKIGNVVRLYMGDYDLKDWSGDDWEDTPYEHNAGEVYDRYVHHYLDLFIDPDYDVWEPADDTNNSPYCKNDFMKGKAPAVSISRGNWSYAMSIADRGSLNIYYGDKEEDVKDYWGIRFSEKRGK